MSSSHCCRPRSFCLCVSLTDGARVIAAVESFYAVLLVLYDVSHGIIAAQLFVNLGLLASCVALFAGARKRLRWCVVVWLVGNGVYLLFLVVVLVFVLALLSFAGMESSVLSKLVSFWNGEVADDDAHHTREVVKTIARVALMSVSWAYAFVSVWAFCCELYEQDGWDRRSEDRVEMEGFFVSE